MIQGKNGKRVTHNWFDQKNSVLMVLYALRAAPYSLNKYKNYALFHGNKKIGKIDYLIDRYIPLH